MHKLILFHTRPKAPLSVLDGLRNNGTIVDGEQISVQPTLTSIANPNGREMSSDRGEANKGLVGNDRRMTEADLLDALGPIDERHGVVAYVCGPPAMTDWAVDTLKVAEGMEAARIFCEKWW